MVDIYKNLSIIYSVGFRKQKYKTLRKELEL